MFIYIFLTLGVLNSYAFNPFSVLSAGKNVAGLFGGGDGVSEAVSAMDELFQEVKSDDDSLRESRQLEEEVKKLEAVYHEASDIGFSSGDALEQIHAGRDLAQTIRGITEVVRTSRRLIQSLSSLQKRSQNAQIETANYEREQLLLQYEQYNLQKLQEIREIRKELEEEVNKKRLSRLMESDLKRKGAHAIGAKGLLQFPKSDDVVEDGINVAVTLRPYLTGLVLVVLLIRLIFYQFSFGAPDRYWDLIRDVFVCFLMLYCFPEVIRASYSLSQSLAQSVSPQEHGSFSSIWNDVNNSGFDKFTLSVLLSGELFWQALRWVSYLAAVFCFKYLVLVMVVLTPIVVFMSEMFNFPLGWKVFYLGFICLNLWPVLWNLFGRLMDRAANRGFSAVTFVETAIAMILQLGSPLLLYAISKVGSAGASSAVESITGPVKKIAMRSFGSSQGTSSQSGTHRSEHK